MGGRISVSCLSPLEVVHCFATQRNAKVSKPRRKASWQRQPNNAPAFVVCTPLFFLLLLLLLLLLLSPSPFFTLWVIFSLFLLLLWWWVNRPAGRHHPGGRGGEKARKPFPPPSWVPSSGTGYFGPAPLFVAASSDRTCLSLSLGSPFNSSLPTNEPAPLHSTFAHHLFFS